MAIIWQIMAIHRELPYSKHPNYVILTSLYGNMAILFKKNFFIQKRIQLYTTTKKGGLATASPQDERDISVDSVNNTANHFALYLNYHFT